MDKNAKINTAEKINNLIINILSRFRLSVCNRPLILCYHSVSNDAWTFSTPIKDFKQQIKYLVSKKKIITLSELFSDKQTHEQVAITFDDGYEDIYLNAYPILSKLGINATVFVIGNSKRANRKELNNQKKLLSLQQIRELKKNGWEIGFHTDTHSDLSKLSQKGLQKEISTGKIELEKKLRFKLNLFAYPRGYYNNQIERIVAETGYKAAFTVNGGYVDFRNNMLINRIPLYGKMSLSQFKTLLSKIGLSYNMLFLSLLQVKEIISSKLITN